MKATAVVKGKLDFGIGYVMAFGKILQVNEQDRSIVFEMSEEDFYKAFRLYPFVGRKAPKKMAMTFEAIEIA